MIEQFEQQQPKRYQDSILFKLGIIALIILGLLIPSSWIQSLISDREGYQQENIDYVADKWAGRQLVQGPVLALPYKKLITEGRNGKPVTREVVRLLYVLPQTLQIKADVKTERFNSGIYDATVYNSDVLLQGTFAKPDLITLGIDPAGVMYDKARLVFSLSDMKGLKNTPAVKIDGNDYIPEPADGHIPFDKGLQIHFPFVKDSGFSFNYIMAIKGSNELNFLHLGKTTDIEVTSDWGHPGFTGRFHPDSRDTTNKRGFGAKWHMLYYNRPFPQQWTDSDTMLTTVKTRQQAIVGVKLQVAIDQYRKIMRTTKYSTLIILLTFVSLFLTELIKKQRIHLFNYTLIGAAMIVYYTLLLSIAEQTGYNWAYLISSVSTIALIAVFTGSLLKNRQAAGLFSIILSFFYSFIFIIIQMEKLSLLAGSIALFIIVAMLMYFSRKINWDQH